MAAARLDPRLEEILVGRIAVLLHCFPGYAKIPRVGVVEKPWSIEDGTMTPTMKLKRSRILAKHEADVERMYSGHE